MQEEQDYLGLTFGTAYKLLPMRKCTILQLLEEPRCDTGTERNSPEQTDFFKRSCQMSEAPLGWCTETATPHRLRGSETVSGLLRQPLLSHMLWLWFWPMVLSVRINKSKPSLLFERLGHLKYIFKQSLLTNLLLQFLSLFPCFFQCFGNFHTDSFSAAHLILQTRSNWEVMSDN